MESHSPIDFGEVVRVSCHSDAPNVIVICEHASNRIPAALSGLGLSNEALESHIAWDPGALGVAEAMAAALQGVLIAGGISRLVYDCNRPPEALSAIPGHSEIYEIPGNRHLSHDAHLARVRGVYEPFCRAVTDALRRHAGTIRLMVTVHSYTPVYNGVAREVELGLLHGDGDRFARAMMAAIPDTRFDTRLNEPYSAANGVAHTLDLHANPIGMLNVMIELRNDLIQTPEQQANIAAYLTPWILGTLTRLETEARA